MANQGSRILTRLAIRMVVVTLLAGIAAVVFTLQLDNSYRARGLLILAQMPFEQKDEVPGNATFLTEPAQRVNYTQVEMLEALPMPDYKLLLTSEEIAARLRDSLKQRYVDAGIDPGNLTIEEVQRSLEVRSKVHLTTLEEVKYQQVVELLLTANDPKIAADVMNEWMDVSIAMAERMRTVAREGAVEFVQERLDDVLAQLDEANGQVETLEGAWNAEAMAERLSAMETAATTYQLRTSELAFEIARCEAQFKQLDTELETVTPTVSLRKAPTEEAYWLSEALGKSEGAAKKVLVTEEPNPVYTALVQQRAATTAESVGLRAERSAIESELTELGPLVLALRKDLARVTRERSILDVKIKALKKTAEEAGITVQATRMATADFIPEFKIASQAVPPEEKSAPHRSLIVLVAMFLAAVAVPVHLFGMVALRRYARAIDAEESGAAKALE